MEIWSELDWIESQGLRQKTLLNRRLTSESIPTAPSAPVTMPSTLHIANCQPTFMAHKRPAGYLPRDCAIKVEEFITRDRPIKRGLQIPGAIPTDAGKLPRCEKSKGGIVQSRGDQGPCRPFTGVGLTQECGADDASYGVIATHVLEGNLVGRTPDASAVNHTEFMTCGPLVRGLMVKA
jgi:hypothetical protein